MVATFFFFSASLDMMMMWLVASLHSAMFVNFAKFRIAFACMQVNMRDDDMALCYTGIAVEVSLLAGTSWSRTNFAVFPMLFCSYLQGTMWIWTKQCDCCTTNCYGCQDLCCLWWCMSMMMKSQSSCSIEVLNVKWLSCCSCALCQLILLCIFERCLSLLFVVYSFLQAPAYGNADSMAMEAARHVSRQ